MMGIRNKIEDGSGSDNILVYALAMLLVCYIILVQFCWFCIQLSNAAWVLYIHSNGENIKVLLNQSSNTSWIIQNTMTWVCVLVILYSERRPSSISRPLMSFANTSCIALAWLNLQVGYWWSVIRVQEPLYRSICDNQDVASGYCATLKGSAWCSALSWIGILVATLYCLFQVFRARTLSGPLVLFPVQRVNVFMMSILLSGYFIWIVAGCMLITDKGHTISETNSGWTDNWYTSAVLHGNVIAYQAVGWYTVGNKSDTIAWVAVILSWMLSFSTLPLWTFMIDTFLSQDLCRDVDCASREALLAGMGIVCFSSWILSCTHIAAWHSLESGVAQDVVVTDVKAEPVGYDKDSYSPTAYLQQQPGFYQAPQLGNAVYEVRSNPLTTGAE